MRPTACVAAALVSIALFSCRASAPVAESTPESSMLRVLAADEDAGAVRNEVPHAAPVAQAVRDYVKDLDALDYEGCPADFVAAFRTHRDAWVLMGEYLEPFGDLRGEMHDVFDRIGVDSNPTAGEFQRLLGDVWSTWGEVETSLARHGVEVASAGG